MGYLNQSVSFRQNKHQLFYQMSAEESSADSKLHKIEKKITAVDHSYLLQNQKSLENEFIATFKLLQQKGDANNEVFWLYCYYCACLLQSFYQAYDQESSALEYHKIRQQIKLYLRNNGKLDKQQKAIEQNFIESLASKFQSGIKSIIATPFHVSKIRDYVAYVNITRLCWAFTRLTLTQGLNLANDMKLIAQLDAILGTKTDVSKIIAVFRAPINVINYFSVGLFLARFFIDSGMLLKHTFFPSELEKSSTWVERFKYEFYKRHCNFANDLVWACVNLVTNFNHLFKISGPVAGYITAGFLGFDLGMAFYKSHLAKQEFLVKQAQYRAEIADYNNLNKFCELTEQQRRIHIAMLDKLIVELRIDFQIKEATCYFVAAGAALLMFGFTASMLFYTPILVTASYFVCTLGVAMYLTAGTYAKYQEKSLYLEESYMTGQQQRLALKEYDMARDDFTFNMAKNITMPIVLITAFALYWPAALVLTSGYLGFEVYHAYQQLESKKEVSLLATAFNEQIGGMALS